MAVRPMSCKIALGMALAAGWLLSAPAGAVVIGGAKSLPAAHGGAGGMQSIALDRDTLWDRFQAKRLGPPDRFVESQNSITPQSSPNANGLSLPLGGQLAGPILQFGVGLPNVVRDKVCFITGIVSFKTGGRSNQPPFCPPSPN